MEPFHGGGVEFGFFLGNDVFSFQAVDFAADFRQLAEPDFSAVPHNAALNLNAAQIHVFHRNNRNIFFYDDSFFFGMKMPAGVMRQKLNDIFRHRQVAADAVGCYGKFVIRGNQRFCRRIVVETKLSGSDMAPVQTGDDVPAVCRNPAVDEFGTAFSS